MAKYRLPLYENMNLWIVVTPTMEKTMEYCFPNEGEERVRRCEGLVVYRPQDCFMMLRSRGPIRHNTIAHEVTHVCQYFCEQINVKVQPDNHEAYAYMVGHLTEMVYRKLRQWRIEVK